MMRVCSMCLMPETRPRITFNEKGLCSACQWHEEKRSIDWNMRQKELWDLCDSIRGKHKFDCIVPVSGGKDSTYVAHKMRYEYKLKVLTVTITPPLETEIIQGNLQNFLEYGYDNFKITPNPEVSRKINKYGLEQQGRPLLSWTTCLNTVMLQLATTFKIPLIMFGEEGESEYGGSNKLRYTPYYDVKDAIELYTYGSNPEMYKEMFPKDNLLIWEFPTFDEIAASGSKIAHWSYFENWNPYRHFLFAQNKYDMIVREEKSIGTYTNFSQLDTPLYDLHTYFMYLKFGFGRCLQDACIDIRNGRITREEGIALIDKYDGEYPNQFIQMYLDYYKITQNELMDIMKNHTNKNLFEYKNNKLIKKFRIH